MGIADASTGDSEDGGSKRQQRLRAVDPEGLDLIAFGHEHVFRLGSKGRTAVVNPGPLMGYLPSDSSEVAPTFAVYDAHTGRASGFCVDDRGHAHPHTR